MPSKLTLPYPEIGSPFFSNKMINIPNSSIVIRHFFPACPDYDIALIMRKIC